MCMVTDRVNGTSAEALMAGTVYNYNGTGRNVIHLIYKAEYGSINNSVVYDNTLFSDLRAVALISDGATTNAVYTIVCQGRRSNSTIYSPTQDAVVLIRVDKWGTFLSANNLYESDTKVGLYPLHAIRHSNGDIYICGYATENYTKYPAQPDFGPYDTKKSFFLHVNSSGSPTGLPFYQKYNTTYATPTGPAYDYDIATRLVETNTGDIFATGSVNDYQFNSLINKEVYRSATMNLVLDQNLNQISEHHFAMGYISEYTTNLVDNEYGIGLVQRGNDNYIVGNNFSQNTSAVPPFPANFNFGTTTFWVTRVDNSFNFTAGNTRFLFNNDNTCALGTLESATPGNYIVYGQQIYDRCSGGFGAGYDSLRACLVDMNTSFAGGNIVANVTKWVHYNTQTGTGAASTGTPNSYPRLGGGMSNIFWNPTFASRNTVADDIVMSAPRWQPANGSLPARLNLKSMRVHNASLEIPDCPDGFTISSNCSNPVALYQQVKGLGYSVPGPVHIVNKAFSGFTGIFSNDGSADANNFTATVYNGIETKCDPFTPVYREDETTGVQEFTNRSAETKIYPNPAKDQVKILLANNIAGNTNIFVTLSNVYGQIVARLYNGDASGLDSYLQLPNLTMGVYMIQVFADGKPIHQQRLSIQP